MWVGGITSRSLPSHPTLLTRRKDNVVVSLDDKFLEQLSRLFGDLCKDERYIKPTLMEVPVTAPPLQLSTLQVCKPRSPLFHLVRVVQCGKSI